MKHRRLRFYLVVVLLLQLRVVACASDTPAEGSKVAIKTSFAPREVRDYNIDAVISGKAIPSDSPNPVELNASFHLEVRHRYGRREGDGLLPVEITLLKGNVATDGGKLELAPSLYPKLTVLVDREWRISDIFGMPEERLAESIPGINYANHIILFYLPGAAEPRNLGERWSYTVRIPALRESYEFTNAIIREIEVDGVKAAVVKREIVRLPEASERGPRAKFKATAESTFSIEGGRLLKSHAECEIAFLSNKTNGTSQQVDSSLSQATVRIDISPIKKRTQTE